MTIYKSHWFFKSKFANTKISQLFLSLEDIYLAFSQNKCLCIGKNIIPTAQLRVNNSPRTPVISVDSTACHVIKDVVNDFRMRGRTKTWGGFKASWHKVCYIYIVTNYKLLDAWFVCIVLLDLHVMWKDVRVSLESSQVEWSVLEGCKWSSVLLNSSVPALFSLNRNLRRRITRLHVAMCFLYYPVWIRSCFV